MKIRRKKTERSGRWTANTLKLQNADFESNICNRTLRTKTPSIFLNRSGRGRKDRSDSASRVLQPKYGILILRDTGHRWRKTKEQKPWNKAKQILPMNRKQRSFVLRHLCPVHEVKARSTLNCLTSRPPQGRFDRCHSIDNDLTWLFFSWFTACQYPARWTWPCQNIRSWSCLWLFEEKAPCQRVSTTVYEWNNRNRRPVLLSPVYQRGVLI